MSKRSCASCIFRIDPDSQSYFLRESLGVGLCAKGFGPTEVLSLSASKNEAINEALAQACGSYTEQAGPLSVLTEEQVRSTNRVNPVMLPDSELMGQTNDATGLIRSCMQCANLIPASEVAGEGLWTTAVCAAKGLTIPAAKMVEIAGDCGERRIGQRNPDQITSMRLLPPYEGVITIGTLEEPEMEFKPVEIVEPTTYPTDNPVSEEESKAGIRAWRKIENEESGHSVLLPIYRLDYFSEDEQKKIPRTGDDEHPERYVDHMGLVYKATVLWRELDETPALWGMAGSGKTEFYRHMAWLMCLPFERISVTGSTEVEDLAGKMHYEPSRGTYFEYGRIPRAWSKPGVICLDEPNVGPPDVWQFIRPLTDNSKQLVLDMNNGERIARHDDAYLGLAMNPAWDVKNVGTGMIADADGSRLMHIYVELPSEELERQIIQTRCLDDGYKISTETLDAIMKIAVELRALCDDNALPITWGVRPQIKVARASRWFSLSQSYRLATADYLEPEQQQQILDVVKANAPSPRGTGGLLEEAQRSRQRSSPLPSHPF